MGTLRIVIEVPGMGSMAQGIKEVAAMALEKALGKPVRVVEVKEV